MKTTKKKPVTKRRSKPYCATKHVNSALSMADFYIAQCEASAATEQAVLSTLDAFVRKHRVDLVKFIIANSDCREPVELAKRALLVSKWLELKTRDYPKR